MALAGRLQTAKGMIVSAGSTRKNCSEPDRGPAPDHKSDFESPTIPQIIQLFCGGILFVSALGATAVETFFQEQQAIMRALQATTGTALLAFILSCLPVWYRSWKTRS
ncbi:hypothetical protein AGR7A_pAt20256 [Agrobacterium deltaense NCPPB 1641]|uniref:Uncharacterized protein n=1 Tax=Agrobacterium deltaense NCPPB 1641 TaxID=1183425 RepID=A0A1S7U9M4_9HYPH|nr:hypothetical protein AGR7A_pAt20256 [Agrobacterium deltaense NCPPB 1641]